MICKQDYYGADNGVFFNRGYPYQVLAEHTASDGSIVMEIRDENGKIGFLRQESINNFFFEDAPGSLYAVRRYVDGLPCGAYGIDVSYYLVGVFSSLDIAIETWKTLHEEEREDEGDGGHESYDLFVIAPNRVYKREEQPYLGGGSYIE